MKTKIIPIEWEDKPETITIKRLSFGERLELRKKCRKIVTRGGTTQAEIDEKRLAIESFKIGIANAPFDHTNESVILKLDGALAEKLEAEIEKFNRLDEGKKNETGNGSKDRVHDTGRPEGNIRVPAAGNGDRNEALGS